MHVPWRAIFQAILLLFMITGSDFISWLEINHLVFVLNQINSGRSKKKPWSPGLTPSSMETARIKFSRLTEGLRNKSHIRRHAGLEAQVAVWHGDLDRVDG